MRTLELIHSWKKYTLLALVLSCVPQLRAQWTAVVGAQSLDQARQALAFLPNEMWIHAGDNITLTVVTNEPHTVTFLTANQIRNPFSVGCPGYSSSPATVDGSTCVSSPPLAGGQTFTVVFPATGNFKIACGGYPLYSPSPYGLWFAFGLPQDRVNYPVMGNRIDGQSLLRQAKEEFASAL